MSAVNEKVGIKEPIEELNDVENIPEEFTREDNKFIKKTAETFKQNRNQDSAHNSIIEHLLRTSFSSQRIANNDVDKMAYNVLRGEDGKKARVYAPLLQLRKAVDAKKFQEKYPLAPEHIIAKYPNLDTRNKHYVNPMFIRDFINIYSYGNLKVKNWLIEDKATQLNAPKFTMKFNSLVQDINEYAQTTTSLKKFKDVAHRDAIQIVPMPASVNGEKNVDRYAGAMMSDVEVSHNIIASQGALQGIFASDGAFKRLSIKNNHLRVSGEHFITVNGMLSGEISGNTDIDGEPLPSNKIKLLPLRIGGGAKIYILGFTNKSSASDEKCYEYEVIQGVNASNDFRQSKEGINDFHNSHFYDEVDMEELQKLYVTLVLPKRLQQKATKRDYINLMEVLVRRGYAKVV